MGPLSHIGRMKVLLLLIIPLLLQSRSIVRERNDVIKQALIPTLVNIIGHARMEEHGIGDNMDGLLDFMDEEKILDPFLQWLSWFTDMVLEKEQEEEKAEKSDESDESMSIESDESTESDESAEYDKSTESDESTESDNIEEYDERALELEVLEKEELMEESIKKMVEEEENYHSGTIPEDERALEEEVLKKEESLEKSLEEEIYDEEASETGHDKPAMWPGDPKGC